MKSVGCGTYGQVYKMKELSTGEIFAAKADFEPRFLQIEQTNMAKCADSDHIPNVYGKILAVEDRYIMKMDLLGKDLGHIQER